MRNYRDLEVWEKSHRLTLEVYRLSRGFPREELYGLTSQMRRAAISIGANLAEGCGRKTGAELARFVRIAMGSASELDYHLLLSSEFNFMEKKDYERLLLELTRVRKMLWSLLASIEKQIDTAAAAAAKYRIPNTRG